MKHKIKRIKIFLRRNLKWIILLVCSIGFFKILEDVFSKEIMRADIVGYGLISKYLMSDFATKIAKVITNLGGAFFVIFLSLALFIVIKDKKIGILINLNLVIATTINIILKNILQRERPTELRLIDEKGYSFPSGHSMVSMAFYGFLIYLVYKYVENKKIKYSLISCLSVLIFLIGISRIYLGVHYTSDVIAGFLISISYLILYTSISEKYVLNSRKKGAQK